MLATTSNHIFYLFYANNSITEVIAMYSFIQHHKLEEHPKGNTLILYLDTGLFSTEFADDLGNLTDKKAMKLTENIKTYIADKLPHIKVSTIKLMIGSTLIAAFPFGAIQAFASGNAAYENTVNTSQKITVFLNDHIQDYSQPPVIANDTTFVPIREIAESLGATVWWNQASKTVGINKGNTQIAFVLGSDTARVNGKTVTMPPSFIMNNTTMVPIRFISDYLGIDVMWDQSSHSIYLTTKTSQETYTVQAGDNLWLISQKFNISIHQIKNLNKLNSDTIYIGQTLKINETTSETPHDWTGLTYHVQGGDNLWLISQKYNTTVEHIKRLNNLTSNTIYIGQPLKIESSQTTYSVKPGDNLWLISQKYGTTVENLKTINNLTSNTIYVGQKLNVKVTQTTPSQPSTDWPEVTYIVQAGDNITTVSQKFGVSAQEILKYNYMEPDEWLNAGETIAISGYAPRDYAVTPGQDSAPLRTGKLVDWYRDGQYILKRYDVFSITDVDTGKSFQVKMMGGYNHSDVEPLTSRDTDIMKSLYGSWEWTPRAVVIFKDGMNIAGSLSGMPHSDEIIDDNGVLGHFDLYLYNSKSHSGSASQTYLQQHKNMVAKAAGQ